MRLRRFCTVCIVSVLALVFAGPGVRECFAQGVSIAPLRVLFDGRTRSATVFLSNRTAETATYRISLVNRRMLETGEIVVAEEAQTGEFFADDLIRFSPRRVTIAPFGAQTIRLLARRPRGDFPEDVEFRTHLAIRSIPLTPRLQDLENEEKLTAEGKLSVTAVATIETVIPIIMRLGEPKATIAIANPVLKLTGDKSGFPILSLDLLRGGDRSVYGELEVLHVTPDGTRTQIHFARGLAVYYPTPKRTREIVLKQVSPQMLQSGSLQIRFTESEDMHGDQSAQLTIPLGQGLAQVQ
jgi:P pilus assembly chaperone PapD